MSVKRRLALGLWLMLVPLVVVVVGSGYVLESTMAGFNESAFELKGEAMPLAQLHAAIVGVEVSAWGTAYGSGVGVADAYRAGVDRVDGMLTVQLADRRMSGVERADVTAALRAWDQAKKAFELIVAGHLDAATIKARMGAYTAPLHESAELIDRGRLWSEREAAATYSRAGTLRRWALVLMAGVTAAGTLTAVVIGRRMARSVVVPLGKLGEAAQRLGHGELSYRVEVDSGDEMGELALTLNAMAARLEDSREELVHQAFHDTLTGLANRALLMDRAAHALQRAARQGGLVALAVVDLDEFKMVNDSLGHAAGDLVLREVASRVSSAVRDADTPVRLGGDEFAILLEDLESPAEAIEIAARVNEALRAPAIVAGRHVSARASIGIAVGQPGNSAEDMLRNGDLAMYQSKQLGKDRATMFETVMHDAMVERLVLETELREAIEHDQLVLHYQPTFDLASGRTVGVEALVRWHHPTRGMLNPAAFIPLAEETGLVVPLGWWVLDHACVQAAAWRHQNPGASLALSVNISARQLHEPDVEARVRSALARSGLEPDALVLEITESQMMRDTDAARTRMEKLKRIGLRLAIDDFGTGYSSLGYLQTFPVDILKIDKSFVDRVASDDGETAMIKAIIDLARALRLTTVAEGIEATSQWNAMLEMGCELGQGFVFAAPMPAAALESRLFTERVNEDATCD